MSAAGGPQPAPTQSSEGAVYEVFANFRDEAMHHLGSVIASSDALAKMYAAKLYDEWSWSGMIIIRRDKIRSLIAIA